MCGIGCKKESAAREHLLTIGLLSTSCLVSRTPPQLSPLIRRPAGRQLATTANEKHVPGRRSDRFHSTEKLFIWNVAGPLPFAMTPWPKNSPPQVMPMYAALASACAKPCLGVTGLSASVEVAALANSP